MTNEKHRWRRGGWAGGALVALLATAGCDLTVTNPGPVQDSFLNEEGAFPAILNGARRNLARGFTRLALDAAMTSKEAIPGGLFGTEFIQGTLTSDNVDDHWQAMQRARFVAEDGAARMREAGESGATFIEQLLLAAYANRALGHNMCHAVFDAGPAEDFMRYFERAEALFTEAITAAEAAGTTSLREAGLAGRADVHMWLGNWSQAASDASAVPNSHAFRLDHFDLDFDDANEMMFRQAGIPWREYTIWNTFMEGYYEETGDPRMAWRDNPEDPITMVDNLPFLVQLKFTELTSPHTFSSGWEMRLIEAENILVNQPGNFQAAVDLVNEVRTRNVSDIDGEPLPPVSAANLEEAWALLKEERRIELWGEGRRFGDLRRWEIEDRPGAQPMEEMTGRSFCFPIGVSEVDTNQNNLPLTTGDNAPRFP